MTTIGLILLAASAALAASKDWEIRVSAGTSREYIYTDKAATHFSGEAVARNSRSYHGLFNGMHEYLDSWDLVVSGVVLDADRIREARAYPHAIYREYAEGIVEEIVLPDESAALTVRLHGVDAGSHELVPWADMRWIWDTPKPEYSVFWESKNNVLLISRVDKPFPKGHPRWLAITATVPLEFAAQERSRATRYPKDAARQAMGETFPWSPGALRFNADGNEPVIFGFVLGATADDAAEKALGFAAAGADGFDEAKDAKLRRVEGLVEKAGVVVDDTQLNKALRWAMVSMDNLVMNQRGRGIYAGFHWFPTYWGRDSFICVPGACLSTKRYDVSRDIILSFVEHQLTDPDSDRLGRFPNIVDVRNLQYAGVDGTWWLVRAAWKHVIACGDREVLQKVFPHVRLAIEGALEKAVDEFGFITHGDGETWMDAGGETNPYSPRGDRAVEVEALFHHGLLAGAAWARTLATTGNEPETLLSLAKQWEEHAEKLRTNFRQHFWNEKRGYLYDHLNVDDSPDHQMRPNAILALWVSLDLADLEAGDRSGLIVVAPARYDALIPNDWAKEIVHGAMETVVLRHGVTSLDPKDPHFHPRHLDLNRYYYDEAYHNGDVWEWLTGPMVTCMRAVGETDAAKKLLTPVVDEILNRACVGSLREIRDGVDTSGKDEFGGATSQAWSLSEFIRVHLGE
jgi:hypothetical protein